MLFIRPAALSPLVTAQLDVLVRGYVSERVASTVSRDGEVTVIVDPGMVADRRRILDPLAGLGVDPASVTEVVISHHHPDHTLNVALFPRARVHDFWAIYGGDSGQIGSPTASSSRSR